MVADGRSPITASTPTDKDTAVIYRRLWRYVMPHKGIGLIAVIGMAATALIEASLVYLLEPLMDKTLVAKDLGLLYFAGGFAKVVVNGEDAGLYYQSEHPTREYLERMGRPASSIFTFGENGTLYYGERHHYIGFERPGSATSPPVESIAQIKQRALAAPGEAEAS